jgi:hypothetical protein
MDILMNADELVEPENEEEANPEEREGNEEEQKEQNGDDDENHINATITVTDALDESQERD